MGEGLKSLFDVLRKWLDYYEDYMKVANDPAKWALNNTKYNEVISGAFGKTKDDMLEAAGFDQDTWMVKKAELDQEISNLRAENKRCYDMVIKLSKAEANKNLESLTANKSDYNLESPMRTATKYCTQESQDQQVHVKRVRVLTLNQLKDTIHDIMANKQHNDRKNDQSGVGRETMEQYMYTYLTKKYGLKSLVIEWASSIIDVIK